MLSSPGLYLVAFAASSAIALITTPAGVSGAVLLAPFQVSVLGTPSPSVTPTNLLYNVVATPGGIYRYWKQGQTGGTLTKVLLRATIPAVVVGSVVRVELLPGPRAFDTVIAVVLVPLGVWLALSAPTSSRRFTLGPWAITTLAAAVGLVGGIYGIGGGSIMAPVLIGSGRPAREVAPATLVATFVTSVAGVITFLVLALPKHGSVAPDWGVGVALGLGGLLGSYAGARLQRRLPDVLIRRLLGFVVLAVGIRYAWLAAT